MFSNIFSQHTLELDTSWTSLLQNSAGTWVKFDEENNFYNNYSLFTASEGEAAAIRILQKRNANNQLLWETSSRLKVIGFDYNNNPLCKCDHSYGGLFGKNNYLYRLNKTNGSLIDSISVFSELYGNSIYSVEKYSGDLLVYGSGAARLTSSFQPIWILDNNGFVGPGNESNTFIRNDTLFYHFSSSNSSIRYLKLNTGFMGNLLLGLNDNLQNLINCNGITIANRNDWSIIKVIGNIGTQIIPNEYGYLSNTDNSDEFLVLNFSTSKLSKYNTIGNLISSANLPVGVTVSLYLNNFNKPFYYSNGYTYVFCKKNNHLCILTYDNSLNIVNEYTDNGDPSINAMWYSFDANTSGCFAAVGQEFWGSKTNAALVKFCTVDASISEETLTSFSVYPNPTNTTANIQFENIEGVTNLKVITLSGQTVIDQKIDQLNPEKAMSLDVSNLKNGIYFVKVGNHTEKLVIE